MCITLQGQRLVLPTSGPIPCVLYAALARPLRYRWLSLKWSIDNLTDKTISIKSIARMALDLTCSPSPPHPLNCSHLLRWTALCILPKRKILHETILGHIIFRPSTFNRHWKMFAKVFLCFIKGECYGSVNIWKWSWWRLKNICIKSF